jgi:transposase-like protein
MNNEPKASPPPDVRAAQAPAAKTPERVDPEVVPGPRRRLFTAEFKRQVLAEADACAEHGAVGELLRKHGLYSSHLSEWRRQRDEGLRPKKRGRRANAQRAQVEEIAQLKRDKARLELKLAHAEIIIDVQKKLSVLLGIPLKTPDSDGSDE